jgi:hypothetical protein
MWLGLPVTLCFHCVEMPYLVTDACSGLCDWTWDSSYNAKIYLMYFLWKSFSTTACDLGCQSLCVFTVQKCSILSQIHVLVFVTEHETPVTLQINIRCILCEKVVRQQHVSGVTSHFVFSMCGNAVSCHGYMFRCLWLNIRLQLCCKYIYNVFWFKKL